MSSASRRSEKRTIAVFVSLIFVASGLVIFRAPALSSTSCPDVQTWTTQTSAADNDWLSVAWGGPAGQEKFVAVAYSGTGNRVMTSPDGITWTT
ncbi:MAG: hypothetical protein ACO38I_09720, partial [Ilumatobacteraceae bacterium]